MESLEPVIRPLAFVVGATIAVPFILFWSPAISFLAQALLGCWLGSGIWILINTQPSTVDNLKNFLLGSMGLSSAPADPKAQKGGPLELVVSLPALPILYIEGILRGFGLTPQLRFIPLSICAYVTAPIWFLIISLMHLLLLLAVTAVSFGVLFPWTAPLMGTLGVYLFFVPVWVISTYVCTAAPIFICTLALPFLDPKATKAKAFLRMTGLTMPFKAVKV
mmetsp:Transcript_35884/g.55970  ORF Transcript_35884/g.55970 Transcript_35884/m.55970 type:complete len:221 (-) Transcript_35884:103-765(-)|eukprot:CAMPEP_0184326516 /NCGR_PEP_ID=MMETSP1049-20130417/142603_1 /TAXON_ID=77928 /ORGANISM="Proteomonas sulcata, Strain CCMP704" /LENGTH=220 /DNA_ID=CAMNT_0026648719 /DNA_START=140 /DNA_END=802 /DNA_ORIENTATION=+